MASTGGCAPPMFADTAKFNGMNWVTWKGLIKIAAELRGVYRYLDGSIQNPTGVVIPNPLTVPLPPSTPAEGASPTQTVTQLPPPADTPWESLFPSPSEWRVRNAWAMGLLIYNTSDPVGLGINISGTAADAWKSYT
ncbi:hypothetical protein AGABI2DRAFT_79218, partial [Agaricus bisporus var. bisporus H97]|uniref:hypothetical protein n=1 Tax=Agaricus bisporus var. bisporus (strain H97 / ATCC MYA-4626 / FGSC 10389) TaxID=936046 RepID=UPI00029F75DD